MVKNNSYDGAHIVFHKMTRTDQYDEKHQVKKVETVLLVKRTLNAHSDAGLWDLPGGRRENNETPEDTVRREVKEELKLVGRFCGLRKSFREMKPLHSVNKHEFFKAPLDTEMDRLILRKDKTYNKVEAEGIGWFSEKEVCNMGIRTNALAALKAYFESLKREM